MTCKANNCYNSTNYSWNEYCSYHENCLSKLRQYQSINNIQEIETFTTWFNGNCGYVINYDYSVSSAYPHCVWIVVYEPAARSMGENLSAIRRSNWNSLSVAREQAQRLKEKLQNEHFYVTPMLEVNTKVSSFETFDSLITSPYVVRENLAGGIIPIVNFNLTNVEHHFKPLDVVWAGRRHVSGIPYYHVGIYLGKDNNGKNWVCHLNNSDGVKITDWDDFLGGFNYGLIRYHPMLPFKHYSRMAQQIAATEDVNWRREDYSLFNRNCEHFANMVVYGIDYSKQVEDNKSGIVGVSRTAMMPFVGPLGILLPVEPKTFNNDKGSTIKLTLEMNESNRKLGRKTNYWSNWVEQQTKQEVPPKQNCRIM